MDALSHLSTALAGRYSLEREIGRGGMATVYLARDVRHQRLVALKVLDPELGAVLGVERFLSEIRVTANLQHPNLLPLFDSGEADGLLFYVMPYVEGESLRHRLEREKQLPLDEGIRIAIAVANALDYAHAHGVIHRDLKPENILLQAGQPMIADFGIALAVSNAGGSRITQTGLSLGTPQYMSPEQATGDRTVDGRTDIYSLAAVTYEMLTGEPPHTGNTAQAIIAKLMTDDVRPLTLLRRAVPPYVDAAVRHALERLPADRFATAREFADALQGRALNVTTSQPVDVKPPRASRVPARLKDPVLLGLAALLIAAIAIPRGGGHPARTLTVTSLVPPPNQDFSEAESFGALSPDGRRFAFVSLGARGETKLWVRRLDTLAAQPLPGTEGARAPFWSPDGKSLAFFVGDQLAVSDIVGGAPRVVCQAKLAYGGSWGRGDVIVVATELGIEKGTATGSSCSLAIKRDSSRIGFRHPTLLPDGRRVLFTSYGEPTRILAGDLETGTTQVVLDQAIDPTIIGSDILVFGQPATEGESKLFAQRFNASTLRVEGTPVPISEGVRTSAGIFAYAVSPDALIYLPGLGDHGEVRTDRVGRVLDSVRAPGAWMHAWAREHPWIAHTRDAAVTRFDVVKQMDVPARRIGGGAYSGPAWSPGDSLLAFMECRDGKCGITGVRIADGRDTVFTVFDDRVRIWPASWSLDGRYIVGTQMRQFSAHAAEIWTYDLVERKLAPLVAPGFGVLEPSVSPDGKWIAYRSQESGAAEVVVRPFMRPGAPQRVSIAGGRHPYWRNDARELVFQAPDGRVMSAAVEPGPGGALTIAAPRPLFTAPAWTRHLFFDVGTSFGASPDLQQFTFRMTATSATAVIVENWQSLLRN